MGGSLCPPHPQPPSNTRDATGSRTTGACNRVLSWRRPRSASAESSRRPPPFGGAPSRRSRCATVAGPVVFDEAQATAVVLQYFDSEETCGSAPRPSPRWIRQRRPARASRWTRASSGRGHQRDVRGSHRRASLIARGKHISAATGRICAGGDDERARRSATRRRDAAGTIFRGDEARLNCRYRLMASTARTRWKLMATSDCSGPGSSFSADGASSGAQSPPVRAPRDFTASSSSSRREQPASTGWSSRTSSST